MRIRTKDKSYSDPRREPGNGECINPIKEEPVHSPGYSSARDF
jgi:hypothetical protein